MDTWVWIVIAAAVAIVLIVAVLVVLRRPRRRRLQERLGPEYDRTVEGQRRGRAERDLDERVKQHDQLEIRPLSPSARERYVRDWEALQSQFVDRPEVAIESADSLVSQVMRERGYPVERFEEQADLVSVDHPHVVDNYRAAHRTYERHSRQSTSTEDLRQALVCYRTLFDELVAAGDGDGRVR
ncbi:MAG: hypothetical protein ACRDY4_08085 [Acidimicrobiia bacterium]